MRFDAELDALLISSEALARANILGDEGISRYLTSHLDAELSEITLEETLVGRAKDAIAQGLSEGVPKMVDIARGLGLSGWSFHRRLFRTGHEFSGADGRDAPGTGRRAPARSELHLGGDRISDRVFGAKLLHARFQALGRENTGKLPQGPCRYVRRTIGNECQNRGEAGQDRARACALSLLRIPASQGGLFMQTKPILVIGATGKTGSRVCARLEALGLPVRSGSRNSSTPFDWEAPQT
ncbi:hypothetical protein [Breoghania sp.]|uniref:hypothetical protein n=1 Tax=Breoghania sp. TaxID=2065378 RepID=UPI0032046E1B